MTPSAWNVGSDQPIIFTNGLAFELKLEAHLCEVPALCKHPSGIGSSSTMHLK